MKNHINDEEKWDELLNSEDGKKLLENLMEEAEKDFESGNYTEEKQEKTI